MFVIAKGTLLSQFPLTHRPMGIGDITDFYLKKRSDWLLKPIFIGEPTTSLWLKLEFMELKTGQGMLMKVAENLYHPETGELLAKKGSELLADYKELRVAKRY